LYLARLDQGSFPSFLPPVRATKPYFIDVSLFSPPSWSGGLCFKTRLKRQSEKIPFFPPPSSERRASFPSRLEEALSRKTFFFSRRGNDLLGAVGPPPLLPRLHKCYRDYGVNGLFPPIVSLLSCESDRPRGIVPPPSSFRGQVGGGLSHTARRLMT